jgi:hypothetical protein
MMKSFTRSLLLLFLLCQAPAAQGQALIALLFGKKVTNNRLHLGIYLGGSSSWLTNAAGQMPRFGFAIGAYTTYDLTTKWQLAADIIMKSPKGAKNLRYSNSFVIPDDQNFIGQELDRRYTYLSFAPLVRYNLTSSFSLAAGLYLAGRIKAKDIYHVEMENGKSAYTYNARSETHLADVGGVIDLQYVLMKGKGVRLNAQTNIGFINSYKNTDTRSVNRQVLIGIGIPIGKR